MSERLSFAEMLKQTEQKNKTKLELVDPTKPNQTQDKQTQPKTTKGHPTQPNPTKSKPTQPNPTKAEVSPTKNFTKVPNSHTKKAIPQRVFRGLSKDTYDVLYHHTRGAINPTRTIQLNKRELMKLTGLSDNTVQTHIKYLKESGIIFVHEQPGKHQGSIYEVFIWEELDLTQPNPTQADQTEHNQAQNLVPDQTQKVDLVGYSNKTENKEDSNVPKTLINTNTENDDDLVKIRRMLSSAARGKTGRDLNKKDYSALLDVFELLIAETEIAAARTNSVSAYIPFMAENLRRRLHAKPKVEKKGIEIKKDTVGKTSVISTPEPLDEESKENLLKTYRQSLAEYGMEWVDQNESYFAPEDWQWLKSNLEAKD